MDVFLMICIYMYSIMWNVENTLLFVCICYVIYVMDVCLFINSRLAKYQKLKITTLVNGNACQQNVINVIVFSLHH